MLLLEDVLDLLAGLLRVTLGLVGLPLGLQLVVADGLAGGLLGLALDLFGLVTGLIGSTHAIAPHRGIGRLSTIPCPVKWGTNVMYLTTQLCPTPRRICVF